MTPLQKTPTIPITLGTGVSRSHYISWLSRDVTTTYKAAESNQNMYFEPNTEAFLTLTNWFCVNLTRAEEQRCDYRELIREII